MDQDLNYKITDENYQNEKKVFVTCYNHENAQIGFKLSPEDEKLFKQAILKASKVELKTEIKEKEVVSNPFMFCINYIKTKKQNVKRGAVVKGLAICSTNNFCFSFKPLLKLALEEMFTQDPEKVIKELYDIINGLDLSHINPYTDLEVG